MTVWVTSDQHYSHHNIIKYCNRPFVNAHEMNHKLINNHNSVVSKGDTVYMLGDFLFKSNDGLDADWFLSNLNGNKILITGNHDSDKTKKARGWGSVHETIYETKIEDKYVVMCHYAMRTWNGAFHGSWHLWGHSHGKLPAYGKSFDVGVDCWNYFPVSWEQVKEKMNTLEQVKV